MRMSKMMLVAFMDEMVKMATQSYASTTTVKPMKAPASSTPKPLTMKTELKPTNYTSVNTETRDMGYGPAEQVKMTPPPPVRA